MRKLCLVGRWVLGLGLLGVWSCDRGPGPETCFDVCGPRTRCEAGKCVVEPDADEAAADSGDRRSRSKRRKRRKRRKRGNREKATSDDFRPIDDAHVPPFDPKKTQVIDMKAGSERLSDAQVSTAMRRAEPQLNRCIATAAQHSEHEIAPGTISLVLSVERSGRVSSVSAKAPPHLRVFGIVPCVRVAAAAVRFPSYDGSTMGVDYAFRVE